MKPLKEYIKEKLVINKDTNVDMTASNEEIWEKLEEVSDKADLYDDEIYPKDIWDYWEDASGHDDSTIVDELDRFFRNCSVIGWQSETSFDDIEKKIPECLIKFIEQKPDATVHDRYSSMMMWERYEKDSRSTLKVAKFKKHYNVNGTDKIGYWIVAALEK